MSVTIVLGAQWGDEGKGKLVDILCPSAQICARAQGGHNAGHTIVADNVSYDFHLLPSGLLNPKCKNYIGSGVVVHVPTFFEELAKLEKPSVKGDQKKQGETEKQPGLKNVRDRIFISDRCHIILDLHIAVDGLEELELGAQSIGTTKRGIGPTYSTMAARSGVRVCDLLHDFQGFESRVRALAAGYKTRYGDLLKYDVEEELTRFKEYRESLRSYVIDLISIMDDAQKKKENILVEGANAIMLDIIWGSYPYVTSSNTGVSGILAGLALDMRNVKSVIGVVKAYTTRVGSGPFPTEEHGEVGNKLQEIGREWGTSTKRRRRCGWLDLVVLKYSHLINHYHFLNLTKLDILDTFPEIKVATAYIDPETKERKPFPASLTVLSRYEVEYQTLEGWNAPTTAITKYEELPPQAKKYVEYIEEFIGVPIKWIGTGPGREHMIVR